MKSIYIKFFGIFDMQVEGVSIVKIKSAKNRVKKLFGLLLLERNRKYSDEELVLRIWQDENVANQETALTKLVYLARKELKKVDDKQEFIIRQDGKYIWNPDIPVEMDVRELEYFCREMQREDIGDVEKLSLGRKAASLYDGELAANFEYAIWSLPISEYYNALFLSAAEMACEFLEARGDRDSWEECINIAAKASKYAVNTYKCYVMIFKGLKALNRRHSIVEYYERLVEYHRKNAEQPIPNEIKKIYNWAIRSEELTFSDIEEIADSLRERSKEDEITGAYYCEMEMFRNMAHFIFRNSIRREHDIVVMLVNIVEFEEIDINQREREMDVLEDVILASLRKDDIVSRYSINQFIIMPFECGSENIDIIEGRLNSRFEKKKSSEDLSLDIVNFKMAESGYELVC